MDIFGFRGGNCILCEEVVGLGYDVYYPCIDISVVSDMSDLTDVRLRGSVLLCRFQCEDEHGNRLAPQTGFVSVVGGEAAVVRYPENILKDLDGATDEDFEELQKLLDEYPVDDYYFSNAGAIGRKLRKLRKEAK